MGWMPGAIRRDVGAPAKYSNGPMRSYLGVVLHVNDADSGDLYGWITGNHDMSCHWQVLKDGTVYQYIDTAYSSWCQAGGNDDYLSIETSGFPNEPLTDAQLSACARIIAYVHAEHGIPLQLAEKPGDRGFGWHGMGAPGWGHAACPGDLRKAQRAAILQLAQTNPNGDDMPLTDAEWKRLDELLQLRINNALTSQRNWINYFYGPEVLGSSQREHDNTLALAGQLNTLHAAELEAIGKLAQPAGSSGAVDPAAVEAAAQAGAAKALDGATATVTIHPGGTSS